MALEDTGGSGYQFYDYQVQHQRSFPLLHSSSRWDLYRLVRVSCATNQTLSGSTSGAGADCRTSAEGGRFRGVGHIQMEAIDSCPIRFEMAAGTTPPSDPTRKSRLYTGPIAITATTSFKATLACANASEKKMLWLPTLTFTSEDDTHAMEDGRAHTRKTLKTDDEEEGHSLLSGKGGQEDEGFLPSVYEADPTWQPRVPASLNVSGVSAVATCAEQARPPPITLEYPFVWEKGY